RSAIQRSKRIKEWGSRENIWEIQPDKSNKTGHPATFPLDLAEDHIKTWSREGDVIMDIFTGSGTTAIASHRLNRKFIGFEISAGYANLATERYEKEKSQYTIFDFI